MKMKGITLIEILIALSIASIIITVSYSLINFSGKFLNRNIEFLHNEADLETAIKLLSDDIKFSQDDPDVSNVLTTNSTQYELIFNKKYVDKDLYKLVRKINGSETVLLFNVTDFNVSKNGNIYNVSINYWDGEKENTKNFSVFRKMLSSSIVISPEQPSFDYKGYFVTIDCLQNPMVGIMELPYEKSSFSNNLEFSFYSFGNINTNYDFMVSNNGKELGYNIGYINDRYDYFYDGEKYSYLKPYYFENNKPVFNGIYIKNIDKLDDKQVIEIDASNLDFKIYFEVELQNVNKKLYYNPKKNGNNGKNIKIFYKNGKLHYTGQLDES